MGYISRGLVIVLLVLPGDQPRGVRDHRDRGELVQQRTGHRTQNAGDRQPDSERKYAE